MLVTLRRIGKHIKLNPFSTALPMWGQSTQFLGSLSPKRGCGSKRVKLTTRPRLEYYCQWNQSLPLQQQKEPSVPPVNISLTTHRHLFRVPEDGK